MKKFVIIGDYESVVLYNLFGWDVVYVNLNEKEEMLKKFDEVVKTNMYDKIFLVEDVYEIVQQNYPNIEKIALSLIPLPGIRGSKKLAKHKYEKLALIATGIKLE